MTEKPHHWIRARHAHDRRRAAPADALALSAHRRLRGPYTAGGALLRALVPEIWRRRPDLVARHEVEIHSLAPELRDLVPATRETLTSLAVPQERTRFYSRLRTLRIAHGIAEFLNAALDDGSPRHVFIDHLDHADPTDRELIAVLLRRADPARLRLHVATGLAPLEPPPGPAAVSLPDMLRRFADAEELPETPLPPLGPGDPAAAFVAADGTADDPRLRDAYVALDPRDRAQLHDSRADELAAGGDRSWRLGAIPYHAEHGSTPGERGVSALRGALEHCVDVGFYHATVDYGARGRAIVDWDAQLEHWWAFTTKMTTSLAALGLPDEALTLYQEARAHTSDPLVHLQAAYATAMLHTRYLPKDQQDHRTARGWANLAIALAKGLDDPDMRAFKTVFNQNGLALVAVHEGRLEEALQLVTDGLHRLDTDLAAHRHALHRSVLRHNRHQVLAGLGRPAEALADLDLVIASDPRYPEYHFDRGTLLRRLGRPEEAIASYERALTLSPPFPEVFYNRGDARLETGDVEGALADFDHVLELDEDHVDALVNRAGLRLAAGDTAGADADVRHGLGLDPDNPHLRCLHGQLLAADDPAAGIAVLDALVAAHPDFAEGWAGYAAAVYEQGDLAGAVAGFDRALALADDPGTRFNRGVALAGLGRFDAALADFTAVLAATGDPDAAEQAAFCRQQRDAVRV